MSQLKLNLGDSIDSQIERIKQRIQAFRKPESYKQSAWDSLVDNAMNVWNAYLQGQAWSQPISITCRESYLMLINEEGRLIVQDERLLDWVCNRYTSAWAAHLESFALEAARAGEYKKALHYFQKVLKIRPNSHFILYQCALVKERSGDIDGALKDVNAAIALEPRIDELFLKRASIHVTLGNTQHAMYDLATAIRLDPKDPRAYIQRSLIRKEQGDMAGGKADLKIALELQAPFGGAKYLNLIDGAQPRSSQAA